MSRGNCHFTQLLSLHYLLNAASLITLIIFAIDSQILLLVNLINDFIGNPMLLKQPFSLGKQTLDLNFFLNNYEICTQGTRMTPEEFFSYCKVDSIKRTLSTDQVEQFSSD